MQTEDRQIIHQCLNGDTAMFGFLVDKYREGVYALAYSRLGNFHDAQDIAQEAFIKAYRKLHTLRHWDNFALWLSAITNNLCKNFIRAKSNRPDRKFADDQSQQIIDHTSVDSYRETQADESLKEALNSLPVIYRQVLVLHYLSGYTSMDIAHLLGISVRTVAERLRVGRERLKEEMVSMMSTTLKEQRLPAGFTFKIVEMVKRIRIHPITQTKGLPWGLSLATGIIITIFCLNPYMNYFSQIDIPAGAPLPSETKVLKTGEIPVDILKTSQITVISSKVEKGKGGEQKQPDMQDAIFMAPQAEGGEWKQKAHIPTPRFYLSTCAVNGKIYAIGGMANVSNSLATVEEYDPATDIWTKKADMQFPRSCLATSVVNGKIYVIGGSAWKGGMVQALYNRVDEYNPATGKWTKKADMPTARSAPSSCVLNNKIYVSGGVVGPNDTIPAFEEYDPATDSWTKRADMLSNRCAHKTCSVNGKIYAIGGLINLNGSSKSIVDEYDPERDVWTRKANMPTARESLSVSVINEKIYAIGGGDDIAFATVEEYDPLTDIWVKKTGMLNGREGLSTSVVNGKIYAIGGAGLPGFVTIAPIEEYTPEDWQPDQSVSPQGKLPSKWGNLKSR